MSDKYEFELPSDDGGVFKSKDHLPLVLFFYPKDNTPGCTIENKDFSAKNAKFRELGYTVAGVSRDTVESHCRFRDKHELKAHLLSDKEEKVCGMFDVIKEKNMFGKKVKGIVRSTFILDKDGKIVKEWRKVKVAGHVDEVLEYLIRGDKK